jgi:hypothetical protein
LDYAFRVNLEVFDKLRFLLLFFQPMLKPR